jgi:hypothetical protein
VIGGFIKEVVDQILYELLLVSFVANRATEC